MKILLTGASGMVGKNILSDSRSSEYDFLFPKRSEVNLLNYNELDEYISSLKPDLVIHAAGKVGGIQANINNPLSFFKENLEMGMNIINICSYHNIPELINIGSSCMYPRNINHPLKEDLILKGELEPTNEGYALAKIAIAKHCEYVTKSKNLNYKTIIPCNLYGPYERFDHENSHMIAGVIKKLYDAKRDNSEKVDIWGDGEARREFMCAIDLADFIFYAITKLDIMPQNLNVGLGFDMSINDYYMEIAKVVGFKGYFINDLSKPEGMKRKLVDISRLEEFGWKHKISLKKGLQETYKYFLTKQNDEI